VIAELHDRDVIEPKKANLLTQGEKNKALHYLMFLEKKKMWTYQRPGMR